MITAKVSELQAALTTYLEHVRAGEQVVVIDQGKEIARLVPAAGRRLTSLSYEDLVTSGLVIPPQKKTSPEFQSLPRIADPHGLLLNAVLTEREEGR